MPSTLPMFTMLDPGCMTRPHACAIQYEPIRLTSDDPPEVVGVLARGGVRRAQAGVVDQDVDPAELVHAGLHDLGAVLDRRHVGGHRDAAAPQPLDGGAGLLQALDAAGGDDDVGAGLGQAAGEVDAEPGRGAGDHGDLAVEAEAIQDAHGAAA
jgi:hypothetical protein